MIRRWGGRGISIAFGLVLVACGDDVEPELADDTESLSESVPEQALQWTPCGDVECATLQVPLDHDAPEGATLGLAINRVRASEGVPYRGLIVFNPGGPGVPGKSAIAELAPALRVLLPGFDVVGFDPRGTGESAPLPCVLDVDPNQAYLSGGADAAIAVFAGLGTRCAEATGLLFENLGSNEVVRDIDAIRAALGQDQLTFWGISYGTRLGALYAQTFPEHTRAVLLDAPVPARADNIEFVSGQFDALLLAQAEFFADCAAGVLACPEQPEQVFDALFAAAEAEGLAEPLSVIWALSLASPPGRESLAQLLTSAASDAPGAMDGMMAGGMEAPPDPSVQQLLTAINPATNVTVHCADNAEPPLAAADGGALMASFLQRSSVFASRGLAALACSGWPVERDPVPDISFTLAVPPLVITGLHDILTLTAWGEEMALATGGRLLLSDHYGHGATGTGGPCAIQAIVAYLNDLALPAEGTTCPGP